MGGFTVLPKTEKHTEKSHNKILRCRFYPFIDSKMSVPSVSERYKYSPVIKPGPFKVFITGFLCSKVFLRLKPPLLLHDLGLPPNQKISFKSTSKHISITSDEFHDLFCTFLRKKTLEKKERVVFSYENHLKMFVREKKSVKLKLLISYDGLWHYC